MRATLSAERVSNGVIGGAWKITAWQEGEFLGSQAFLYYTKREALREAREIIKKEGGLGIFRKSWA
jgi:hypothetical protein